MDLKLRSMDFSSELWGSRLLISPDLNICVQILHIASLNSSFPWQFDIISWVSLRFLVLGIKNVN